MSAWRNWTAQWAANPKACRFESCRRHPAVGVSGSAPACDAGGSGSSPLRLTVARNNGKPGPTRVKNIGTTYGGNKPWWDWLSHKQFPGEFDSHSRYHSPG